MNDKVDTNNGKSLIDSLKYLNEKVEHLRELKNFSNSVYEKFLDPLSLAKHPIGNLNDDHNKPPVKVPNDEPDIVNMLDLYYAIGDDLETVIRGIQNNIYKINNIVSGD